MTLLNFAGSKCGNNVCLLWLTENEQNFSHFEIEKSNDGRNFVTLNNVPARNTAGRNTYTSSDASPVNGDNFYRLKITDLDGTIRYSKIIKVNIGKPELVSAQPNPSSDIVIIKGVADYRELRVVDLNGKVMQQQNIQKSIEEINVSKLSTGVYIIQLVNDSKTTTLKLVKQ